MSEHDERALARMKLLVDTKIDIQPYESRKRILEHAFGEPVHKCQNTTITRSNGTLVVECDEPPLLRNRVEDGFVQALVDVQRVLNTALEQQGEDAQALFHAAMESRK